MATLTEQLPAQAAHDLVLNLIAQRWAQVGYCKVSVRPGDVSGAWPQIRDIGPDLVGWQYGGGHRRLEWIAEVETQESLTQTGQEGRWRAGVALGLPFFLYVPRGFRGVAQQLAADAGVRLNGIYEYSFVNNMFQLL